MSTFKLSKEASFARQRLHQSFLLAELSEGEGVVAGVQLLGLELGPSSLEVGHLFLDHPALLLHSLLLLRHALLHLVEAGVQLEQKVTS